MKTCFLLLLLPLFFCSCNHYFYSPNTQNVPGFQEKGEARVMVGSMNGDEIEGFEVQSAYSPAKHLGLMFNYASAKGGSDFNRGYGHQVEGGIGYYLPITGKSVFEVYAGYGGGSIYNQYESLESYTLRFSKFFVQPSFGYHSDYFDALFSLRLAYLNQRSSDIVNTMYSAHSVLIEVENTPNYFLFEPAFTLRGGWKYIKVQTQLSGSVNMTNPNFPQEETIFSIGLYCSFSPRWMNGRIIKSGANSL